MLSRHLVRRVGTFAAVACLPLVAAAQSVGVNWRTNLDAAKVEAAQSGKFLLLHFTTRNCPPCRMLDQYVFSQPQVAAAIEQDFVPVRIDADASPALAGSMRIDRVPTEIIMTPEGQELGRPSIPDKPEAYVGQLQNMARHFRQTAGAGPLGGAAAQVNPAYANVGVGQPAPAMTPPAFAAQGAQPNLVPPLQQAQQGPPQQALPPQSQVNPYVSAAPASRYGEAQSVYAPPSAQQGLDSPPAPQQTAPPHIAQQPQAAVQPPPSAAAAMSPAGPVDNSPAQPREASGPGTAQAAAGVGGAAAVVAAAVQKPQPPEQPAGAPPLAFGGCCPVTMKTVRKWAYGDAQFGAVHRGRTYLFAGAAERDQFLADPDAYAPVFAGLDPVLLIDRQQSVEGKRDFGYEYGGLFYLFSSKESMDKFAASPHTYAAGVRQAMSRIDSAGGTVRR